MIGRYVILRSRDQGVVCGVLKTLTPQPGGLACAELEDASQIHHWQGGVNTLFEASLRGFGVARISEPVAEFMIFGVCGVFPCTPEAEANLRQHRWNESPKNSASHLRRAKQTG